MTANKEFAVVRCNTDSSLDTPFDSDGIVTTAIGSGDDDAYAVDIQTDAKILVPDRLSIGSDFDFALLRYWPGPRPRRAGAAPSSQFL